MLFAFPVGSSISFVSKLLIDSYLDQTSKRNTCRDLKRRKVVTIRMISVADCHRAPCNQNIPSFTFAQTALMALFKFTTQLSNQVFIICLVITIPFMFIDF